LLPLQVACGIGVTDSIVALTTSIVSRPWAASIAVGVAWVVAWALAFARAAQVRDALVRRPWLLPLIAAAGMIPVLFDGGYPGNLGTQPIWMVIVAAAVGGWRLTLATGVALFVAKSAVFAATDTGPPPLGESARTEARTAVFLPLALVPLSLALGIAMRKVIAAAQQVEVAEELLPAPEVTVPEPPLDPEALSPAERAVVGLLADGLTPKEIAVARGTSLATVRTQIKSAKRTSGARTLDQLVAADRRSA
jgi:DNA-binding CsgD family transcriptional regulator